MCLPALLSSFILAGLVSCSFGPIFDFSMVHTETVASSPTYYNLKLRALIFFTLNLCCGVDAEASERHHDSGGDGASHTDTATSAAAATLHTAAPAPASALPAQRIEHSGGDVASHTTTPAFAGAATLHTAASAPASAQPAQRTEQFSAALSAGSVTAAAAAAAVTAAMSLHSSQSFQHCS